jgi:hypothetical protein
LRERNPQGGLRLKQLKDVVAIVNPAGTSEFPEVLREERCYL